MRTFSTQGLQVQTLKPVIAAIVALLFVSPGEAAPKWLKRAVEYSVYAAPVVTSILATREGHRCRQRNGVEPCTAGYGAFAGVEGARFGVSLTFSGLSMFGHKQGYKEWLLPAAGIAAFNGYWAYSQAHINSPEREEHRGKR